MKQRTSSLLGRWIVRCHPPGWRRRYEDEVVDLIESTPATWATWLDLVRSALSAWASEYWQATALGPGQKLGAARVLLLLVNSYGALLVVATGVALADLSWTVIQLTSNGRLDRAAFEIARAWDGAPTPASLMFGLPFFVSWFVAPAAGVALMLRLTGLARQWPRLARLATMGAFAAIALWLLPGPMIGGGLCGGYVFATALIPHRRRPVPALI